MHTDPHALGARLPARAIDEALAYLEVSQKDLLAALRIPISTYHRRLTASETLTQTLPATTTLTQSVAALWKTNDWDDALYTFGVGVAEYFTQPSGRMRLPPAVPSLR